MHHCTPPTRIGHEQGYPRQLYFPCDRFNSLNLTLNNVHVLVLCIRVMYCPVAALQAFEIQIGAHEHGRNPSTSYPVSKVQQPKRLVREENLQVHADLRGQRGRLRRQQYGASSRRRSPLLCAVPPRHNRSDTGGRRVTTQSKILSKTRERHE